MLRSSLRLYQAALPIGKAEFIEAFTRVHPNALQDGPKKLGLAISGGADSMALALMCRDYLPRDRIELHALIVDHGLRPTSSEEALKTSKILSSRLDIKSHILTVKKPAGSTLHALEMKARKWRYEAIAKCCRSEDIKDIVVAHHLDDQYENVIMRIAYNGTSFHIREVSQSPECTEHFSSNGLHYIRTTNKSQNPSQDLECFGIIGIPHLRIDLRRPLLDFTKDRLLATCRAADLPWIEDETNHDPRLTTRNAIRYTIAKHQLPGSLSRNSVVAAAKHVEQRIKAIYSVVDHLLDSTDIELDVRTGSMVVTPPTTEAMQNALPNLGALSSLLTSAALPRVIGTYLNHLTNLVNSSTGTGGTNYPTEMGAFFGTSDHRKSFTANFTFCQPHSHGRWLMSRARPRKSSFPIAQITKMRVRYPYASSTRKPSYRKFDDRWWIRMANPSHNTSLVLRYLSPTHLSYLQWRLKAGEIHLKDVNDPLGTPRNLNSILNSLGPHPLRWWLPVIVERSPAFETYLTSLDVEQRFIKSQNLDDLTAETVVAFPTLNLRIDGNKKNGTVPWWIEDLKWEMYYKDLGWAHHRIDEIVHVPTTKESRGLV